MQIDPKHFNTFLLIVALASAALIAYFIISNRSAEKANFAKRMFAQDSLQTVWWPDVQTEDSVQISQFEGQVVVLDLWSDWSDASLKSHTELARIQRQNSDRLQVVAAAVGLRKEEIANYMDKHQFPFHFVAGSHHFSSFNIPGLPAQFVYDSDIDLKHVFLGYTDDSQYDSLRVLLENEKE